MLLVDKIILMQIQTKNKLYFHKGDFLIFIFLQIFYKYYFELNFDLITNNKLII